MSAVNTNFTIIMENRLLTISFGYYCYVYWPVTVYSVHLKICPELFISQLLGYYLFVHAAQVYLSVCIVNFI